MPVYRPQAYLTTGAPGDQDVVCRRGHSRFPVQSPRGIEYREGQPPQIGRYVTEDSTKKWKWDALTRSFTGFHGPTAEALFAWDEIALQGEFRVWAYTLYYQNNEWLRADETGWLTVKRE